MRGLLGFAYATAEQVCFVLFVKRYILVVVLTPLLCVVHLW